MEQARFTDLLAYIVDNRGKTCPTAPVGVPLIATNCVKNSGIYPTFERVRFVSKATCESWFRGHPKPGDLIFVTKGSPGQVCLVPDPVPFCIAQDMVALRANPKKVYPPYLFAALRSDQVQLAISNMHVGTMIPHFKKGDFDKLSIPLPDKNTQRWIGDMYLELSKKIELNRCANGTLEALAGTLFKDWFVDFGPTRAKMEGRERYLSREIWSEFPDRLVRESLPETWKESTVGAEFKLTMGQSPPGESYNKSENGLPFFQGRTDFGSRYPKKRIFCASPSRVAQVDDTLLSVRAPVGSINMAWEECCLGRGVAAIRHVSGYRGFTYYSFLNLRPALAKFEHSGTVFGAINKPQLEALKFLAPGKGAVDAFELCVRGMDDRIRSNEAEMSTLAEIRDLLLPRIMRSELRIVDGHSIVDGAI